MSSEAQKDWVDEAVEGLPPLLKTSEAAKVLRTTTRTLYRWIAVGRLKTVKRPGAHSSTVLIPKSAIVDYLRGLEAA
jgi:excisionase family DNA binding protein